MKNPFAKKPRNEYNSYDDTYEGGFYRDEDEEDGVVGDFEEKPAAPAPVKRPAVGKSAGKFKVVKPQGYQDGGAIVDYLVDGYAVVLNIEELERPAALRLIDYLLGALQVLDGELRRVTKTTLVLSPRPGELSIDEEKGEDEEI